MNRVSGPYQTFNVFCVLGNCEEIIWSRSFEGEVEENGTVTLHVVWFLVLMLQIWRWSSASIVRLISTLMWWGEESAVFWTKIRYTSPPQWHVINPNIWPLGTFRGDSVTEGWWLIGPGSCGCIGEFYGVDFQLAPMGWGLWSEEGQQWCQVFLMVDGIA